MYKITDSWKFTASMLRGVCLRAVDAKDGKRAGCVLQVNYGDRMLF